MFDIPVTCSLRLQQYANHYPTHCVNFNNLITISCKQRRSNNITSSHFVPSLMSANTMSLLPKLCEVQELLLLISSAVAITK